MNTNIISKYLQIMRNIASMGAPPEINNLLEKIFTDIDFRMVRKQIGRVRIEKVENMQNQIITMINLQAIC